MKRFKKALCITGGAVGTILILLVCAVLYLTIREYRPDPVEDIQVPSGSSRKPAPGDELTFMTYNIGYGGLSQNEDFFMDGGTKVEPESRELVEENMQGIADILAANPADAYFLQEVDINSKRSYHIDEQQYLEKALGLGSMFAYNFKCDFVPYPLPFIGHVEGGLLTMTNMQVQEAVRISLPESFSWPVKTCNLKRCLLKSRIPLEGTDKELVLVNLHLEAYDSGEGKIAQSKMLAEILKEESDKGNYVIAAGDFNQTFEGTNEKYPILVSDYWTPGVISPSDLPEGFSFALDDTYPTCRLLNAPYTGSYETSQVYVIDSFIVSSNVSVKAVEVQDVNFRYTDHQPVKLTVTLTP
ncbi:endonuclease/exonuclease/phosphatase family protein [Murimonas intestini]|uniref:endonuclease/exonuclease/phosphatase family protein n=1 Tax=Murimonas intestini TaxID=1337051 RepID=UPI0011DD7731|nr:endonuclease/exonuclease/phosphatase family protein [Murimonas intestini]